MFRKFVRNARCMMFVLSLASTVAIARAADQWTAPTQEELSMTSEPEAPGASAIYLLREEDTNDSARLYSEHVRLKVLTEGGKDRANVELRYLAGGERSYSISEIEGRTIHPDGKVIPFTGKPYDHMVSKSQGYQYTAKVFTLPDVTVGSIIEYRYKLFLLPNSYVTPEWIVQDDLFLRRGHFAWRTTSGRMVLTGARQQLVSRIGILPILPPGLAIKQTEIGGDGSLLIELDAHDIAPSVTEEHMPPLSSVRYRVLFYYSSYNTVDEFWIGEGKYWAKTQDKFIGPGSAVKEAVQQITLASDSPEQKLRKIYAAVQRLDNSDYSREHSRTEDKAEGLSEVKTTDQVWKNQRGTSVQIAQLFIGMARAAGMKAYAVDVVDRYYSLFLKPYLTLSQLDVELAIVSIDGKEHLFDPGSRYCPYGHVQWSHTETGGLRETETGTLLTAIPGESPQASQIVRVANLKMDEVGAVTGKVDLKYAGGPALRWRRLFLTEGEETVKREMKEGLEAMMPAGMEVKLVSLSNLEDYEQQLAATFEVKGPIGSPTGKRLLIPGDIFETNTKTAFPHEKRELAVWFNYRYTARDAVRINLPPGFQVESVPQDGISKMEKNSSYTLKATADAGSVTVRRDFSLGDIFYTPDKYSALRTFYSNFEAKDQEPIILKTVTAAPAGN